MNARVLVTGGLGYLGGILCEHLLAAGFQVKALDNLMYGQGQQGPVPSTYWPPIRASSFVLGDVCDEALMAAALRDADIIIHLAAIVGAAACDRDPLLATIASTLPTPCDNWRDSRKSAAWLVIYPNTNSGYGITSGAALCTEESPLQPISLYGRTKVDAERASLDCLPAPSRFAWRPCLACRRACASIFW